MPIPEECQGIQDGIDGVRAELDSLEDRFQNAGPAEQPELFRVITILKLQLASLRKQLHDCIASHPSEPSPFPLEVVFTGEVELRTTHPDAPGPYYAKDVTLDLVISGDRKSITITFFPLIKTLPFDVPGGTNTTTITHTGGGMGSYAAGNILMPIMLHFDHSHPLALDSDLSLELSTDPPGSPVTPEPFGQVKLVGSGQFVGGFLGERTGTLTVSGTISMHECARGGPYAATTLGTFKGPGDSVQSFEGDVTLDRVDGGYRLQLTSLHGSITLKQKVDQESSARLTACGKVTIGEKVDQKSQAVIRANSDVTLKQKVDQESSVDVESSRGSIYIIEKIDQQSRAKLKAGGGVQIGQKIDQYSWASIVANGDVIIGEGIDQHSSAAITSLNGSILIGMAIDGHASAVLRAPNGAIEIREKVAGGATVRWSAKSFSCPSTDGGTVTRI